MSETVWFDAKPGEEVQPARQHPEDPSALIISDGVPDWVRLPSELGGQKVRVLGVKVGPCPCGHPHNTNILTLDEPTGIKVASCHARGFIWFR